MSSTYAGELSNLQDCILPLPEVLPGWGERNTQELPAGDDDAAIATRPAVLVTKNPVADPNVPLIAQIIDAIDSGQELTTVAAVARHFGRSERWVQQLFRDYLGIGLKWILQRHRLLQAAEFIRKTQEPDWADLAYDLGYSSQQHFITSFRSAGGNASAVLNSFRTPPED